MSGVLETSDQPGRGRQSPGQGRKSPGQGRQSPVTVALLGFFALALGLGALAGLVWWQVVDLPGYTVASDGGASTDERGLAQFIGSDAWFSGLGLLVGLTLGILGWRRLRQLGWPLSIAVALAALAGALICWAVGYHLGPSAFAPRLAAAKPGDFVPIELTLRAKASLLVWPFAGSVPVLLGSSLGRDDEQPTPLFTGPVFNRAIFRRRSSH